MSLSVKGVVASHPKNVLQNNNNIKNMTNTDNNDILITNSARKKPQPRLNNSKDSKSNPQQVAVARRNARERNRVKQVNNGFANLRERIPNFIASTFESGRGGSKKLSKVETLRMAVEYIRSLEDLLNLDSSTTNYSSSPTKSPTDSCQNISYNYGDMSPSLDDEDDLMSSHSSPPPQQYVRINTSNNTYQIIPANLYDIDNSENMEPHILTSEASLVTNDIDFRAMHLSQHELSLISNNEYCRDSLSPEMYSDHSFSPSNTLVVNRMDQKCFIAAAGDYNASMNIIVKEELDSDLPVISLKTENDLPDNHKGVIDVMHWWESQPQQMERS